MINIRMALKALLQNRLQAVLTLCGMSIGIAMVVIVSGLGRGAQIQIESQIESAGPTLITIKSGNFTPASIVTSGEEDSSGGEVAQGIGAENIFTMGTSGAEVGTTVRQAPGPRKTKHRSPAWPLTQAEVDMVEERIGNVRGVAASVAGNVTLDEGSHHKIRVARVYGFQTGWADMSGWGFLRGRPISSKEQASGAPVMLVSAAVAERLWPGQDPLAQSLGFKGQKVNVIGIIDANEDANSGVIVPTVYMPMKLAQRLLGSETYDEINVRTVSVVTTSKVAADISKGLRELRELPDDTLNDFTVSTQTTSSMPSLGMDPQLARAVHSNIVELEKASWEEMAKSLRQAGRTFTLLLSGAAAVSLLVGGIGVMNIMLVSVVARTREIGLRMALGARMRDVMLQFIIEAVALAVLGGMLGLVLGSLGLLIADNGLQWATAIEPLMLVLAIIVAALTGIVFGYSPARRAASLDPVVALKAE